MKTNQTIKFSFYGFGIEVESSDAEALQNVKRDYSFFLNADCKPSVYIEISPAAPSYQKLPSLRASIYTPRNICYRQKDITYIDYFGKGLTVANLKTKSYKIYSEDPYLRHEITYLTMLSLIGENFDLRGIHRIHGFGVELNGKAVLVLLPRGGGKTTLLLELLKNNNIKLISEDSPLVDRTGKILPLPIRIGASEQEKPNGIPSQYIYFTKRMEFEPKYLIDIEAFKDKISKAPSRPWIVLVGMRSLGPESKITPISKFKTLQEFIRNSVVGLGLYQGVEFLLQHSIVELVGKSGIVLSRLENSLKVIFASRTYSFVVGCDKKKNIQALLNFLAGL